ncbi:hypothetical protein PPS11_30681 [Pseudomonas putida S11]|nr:hypothetical protein PPS11_30681 [Pseudomonas putida S11]
MAKSETARQALLPTLKATSRAVMAIAGAKLVLDRVDDGRGQQQHRQHHPQRFAQPAPHPAGELEAHHQAAQGGNGVKAPGEGVVVLGHGVRASQAKRCL